jgi:hypothetical protein
VAAAGHHRHLHRDVAQDVNPVPGRRVRRRDPRKLPVRTVDSGNWDTSSSWSTNARSWFHAYTRSAALSSSNARTPSRWCRRHQAGDAAPAPKLLSSAAQSAPYTRPRGLPGPSRAVCSPASCSSTDATAARCRRETHHRRWCHRSRAIDLLLTRSARSEPSHSLWLLRNDSSTAHGPS